MMGEPVVDNKDLLRSLLLFTNIFLRLIVKKSYRPRCLQKKCWILPTNIMVKPKKTLSQNGIVTVMKPLRQEHFSQSVVVYPCVGEKTPVEMDYHPHVGKNVCWVRPFSSRSQWVRVRVTLTLTLTVSLNQVTKTHSSTNYIHGFIKTSKRDEYKPT